MCCLLLYVNEIIWAHHFTLFYTQVFMAAVVFSGKNVNAKKCVKHIKQLLLALIYSNWRLAACPTAKPTSSNCIKMHVAI